MKFSLSVSHILFIDILSNSAGGCCYLIQSILWSHGTSIMIMYHKHTRQQHQLNLDAEIISESHFTTLLNAVMLQGCKITFIGKTV